MWSPSCTTSSARRAFSTHTRRVETETPFKLSLLWSGSSTCDERGQQVAEILQEKSPSALQRMRTVLVSERMVLHLWKPAVFRAYLEASHHAIPAPSSGEYILLLHLLQQDAHRGTTSFTKRPFHISTGTASNDKDSIAILKPSVWR